MPRMFDILKGGGNEDDKEKKGKETNLPGKLSEDKEKKKSPDSHVLSFPKKFFGVPEAEKKEKPEDHSLASKKLLSEAKKYGVDSQEKAKALYENALEIIKTLLGKVEKKENLTPYIDTVYELLDSIFSQLVLGDAVLENIHQEREWEYFLPYHIVNVLLLSSFLGAKMGFNKSRMRILGLACIFCDIGMDAFRETVNRPVTLNKEEYDLVKTHVSNSLKIVEGIDKINETVKEIIAMHHERVDGSGYPHGLGSNKINPYAKIIGLVDTYEALAHKRTYRDGMNAHRTIKFLLGSLKSGFDYDALKLLVDKMSIYPIGTIVKLDTGEVARVIGVKPGSPLRPVVMVIQDADGVPLSERKILDLSMSDSPNIAESS